MDSSTELPTKRWQIRVLTGPTRGVARLLEGRLSIGRAATCDLHLGASDVSRQHAQIIEDVGGRHVLVDLASSNGTYVEGREIERHVLEPDTRFSIAEIDLAYEEAREPAGLPAEPPRTDARTLRGTTRLRRSEVLAPEDRGPEPGARPRAGCEAPPAGLADPDGRPLLFLDSEGVEYAGHLIDDIVEYRTLRAQRLRGGIAEPTQRRRFEFLEQRLRQPPSPDPRISQRAYCRFECRLEARLRLASGEAHPCQVRDLGVDGAQLDLVGDGPCPESIVWLTLDLLEGDRPRSVVLSGRVAWTYESFVGLAFAGAPRRVQGRYAERPGPRNRDRFGAVTRPCGLRLSVGSGDS